MSTTRKFAMPIFSAIAGITGIALAIMPTVALADSPGHSPESNTHYVADSPWGSPNLSADDSPWG